MEQLSVGDWVDVQDSVRSHGTIGGWRRSVRRGRVCRVNRVTVDVMMQGLDGQLYGPQRFRRERVTKSEE